MPNPTTQPSQADREELKPCPFCGGEAKLKAWSWPYDRFRVQCAACRCQASGLRADPEDAIAAWNTRFERDTEKRVRESLPNGEWIRLHVWADAEAACDVVINQTTFSSEVMPGERVWYRRGAEAAKASIRMACSYDAQHSPRESLAGEANVERVASSEACIGEKCWCGAPAAKKVGEEILFDDPMPHRHNLTTYVCAAHYAQMMGPLGAKQVGLTTLERTTDAG